MAELSTLGSVIKTAYEGQANTNAFTDAEKTKLSGIETGATADQSAAEILTALLTVDGAGTGLDADLLDGVEAAAFLQNISEDTTPTLGGDLDAGGNNITDLGDVTFKTGAAGGTLRTGTSNADKFQLQAYDVDGAAYVTLIEADAGNDPQLQFLVDYAFFEDANDLTKKFKFSCSGITTGTTRTITVPDENLTLMGAASTATLTNKTFDANGTGNSLSNVDVADLANGTDGELITWDATGAPATVAVGTAGHVLTSNGAGAAPTFQAAAGGGSSSAADLTWASGTQSEVADGASAIAFDFDTDNAYSTAGAKLASWSNNGAEKAYIDKDGATALSGALTVNLATASPNELLLDLQVASSTVASIDEDGDLAARVGTFSSSVSCTQTAFSESSVASNNFTNIGRTGINFSRSENIVVTKSEQNSDTATGTVMYSGQNALPAASTNLTGGPLSIQGGGGASSSAGLAHGGALNLTGGTGYGAGDGGNVVISGGTASGSGAQGIVDISAGTEVHLDQTTADAPFFNFQATADADATSAISTLTTSGSTTHHIQIEINGVTAWIACSTTDPS